MKIGKAAIDAARAAIAPLDTAEWRERYRTGQYPRAELTRDVDKRYRWDLCYASGAYRILADDGDDITDAHMDTALRQIVAPLNVTAAS